MQMVMETVNRLEERVAVLGTADWQFVISYLGHVFRGRIIVAPRIRSRAIGNDLTTEASFLAPFIPSIAPSSERKFPLLLDEGMEGDDDWLLENCG